MSELVVLLGLLGLLGALVVVGTLFSVAVGAVVTAWLWREQP